MMTIVGGVIRLALYPVQWTLDRSKRDRALREWRLWWRLTCWALGFRGPGLQETAASGKCPAAQ
jgi:hypothetical protein